MKKEKRKEKEKENMYISINKDNNIYQGNHEKKVKKVKKKKKETKKKTCILVLISICSSFRSEVITSYFIQGPDSKT